MNVSRILIKLQLETMESQSFQHPYTYGQDAVTHDFSRLIFTNIFCTGILEGDSDQPGATRKHGNSAKLLIIETLRLYEHNDSANNDEPVPWRQMQIFFFDMK